MKWISDRYRWALVVFGLLYAGFISLGLPYWDSEYTGWVDPARHRSLASWVWAWISPISSDTANWGFHDRIAQFVAYHLSYQIAGYHSWPYVLFRAACYAGLGAMIYTWAMRAIPPAASGKRAASLAAATFFLLAPAPAAALVWIADFAPAAEFAFAALLLVIWTRIERTPASWVRLSLHDPEQRRWLLKWTGTVVAVYLGYKTKADLKLIPVITGAYLLIVRRRQWRLFAIPVGLMLVLAISWNRQIFSRLPPFVPGSGGASENYMWRPASMGNMSEFLWSSQPVHLAGLFRDCTFSLAGWLGPILLAAIAVFAVWRLAEMGKFRLTLEAPENRALLFVAIWLAVDLAGVSALAPISYFFRIRYGIITMVPASILLAAVFGWFCGSWGRLPRWAIATCLLAFLAQSAMNLSRSVWYRASLGGVEIAVDKAYRYVTLKFPSDDLVLFPDFLPYDYREDACPAIRNRRQAGGLEEVARSFRPGRTTVFSRQPPASGQLNLAARIDGCNPGSLFDAVMPCQPGSAIFVMRYVGVEPGHKVGEGPPVAAQAASAAGELLNQSYEACQTHRPKDCIRLARQALALRPSYAEAYNNMAAAYEELEMWNEAIKAAQDALRLKPDFQLARNNLVWSLTQRPKAAK